MKQAIHVGAKVDKNTADNLTDIISTIFKVGYETRMDQSTIVEAIRMVGNVTEVREVSISNSTFGDKVVNMGGEES
jgi:hypothetical protein